MRGSKYLNLNWDLDPQKDCWIQKCRIRRKKWQIPTGKEPEPGIVEPWPELTSGSKNINCRWIFGFAELIVGSEGVGSAAKVLDPQKELTDPEGERDDADPYVKKFACCWREKFVDSPESCLRI